MHVPTPVQAHLLKAVQNLAYDNRQRRETARGSGEDSIAAEVREHMRIGDRSREQIEAVAAAVGAPKSWIDYARAAGERGARWQAGQVMLGDGPLDRRTVTAGMAREVAGLQDMAGIAAAATSRFDGRDRDTAARFRRVMGITWQRLGALAHVLALTEEERHQLWQRGRYHWSTVVADHVRGYSDQQLATRWHRTADIDFTAAAMPLIVLQTAGVTHDDIAAQMPIGPDRMVELTATALAERQPASTPLAVDNPGASIDAAITAATSADPAPATGAFAPESTQPASPPPAIHESGPDL